MSLSTVPSILAIGRLLPTLHQQLQSLGTLHDLPLPISPSSWTPSLEAAAPSVRAAVTTSFGGFPSELFDRLPGLQIIANFGVGVDSIDVEEARRRGIVVTNTPDVLTDDVADLALGLMISAARQLCVADRYVRSGEWVRSGMMPLTVKVTGKRVGIIGLGRIGLAIARRASAFDCPISYFNRRKKDDVPFTYYSSPVDLAANSDFLVVACPLTPETTKIVDRAVLNALGPKGILINIARGPNVDEAELVKALVEGRIGGAGLDVFEDEPRVPEELLTMDNVVLLPHVGSGTEETRGDMGQLTFDNVKAHFEGKQLLTPL